MAHIYLTDTEGREATLDIIAGNSLMQTITDAGFDDLLAICGGMCSCATCHVYIDEDQLEQLSQMNEDEQELLSLSDHRRDNSRLSCQLRMSDALDGLRVTIAPAD